MNATCQCGMSLEPRRGSSCQECGTATCRTCAIELDTQSYCRWCATSIAFAGAPSGI